MRVVCISAECEPWAKTGGLGDVVDALARAVASIGEPESAAEHTVQSQSGSGPAVSWPGARRYLAPCGATG